MNLRTLGLAAALLAAASPAFAASGSIVSPQAGTETSGNSNPNCMFFWTKDNDGIKYGVSINGPSVLNVQKSQMFQTSIYFIDATVTPPTNQTLINQQADCGGTLTHFVYAVQN